MKSKEDILYDLGLGLDPKTDSHILQAMQEYADQESNQIEKRFIPASAGNTVTGYLSAFFSAVHPRVCGEHVALVKAIFKLDGSSPRLRGTLTGGAGFIGSHRFIPASAGNTDYLKSIRLRSPVHPRVCGEHT